MFDEPNQPSEEHPINPADRANDKAGEIRMYAELAAVFEGPRKFDSQILTLAPDHAREIQRSIGRLEKSKTQGTPILPQSSIADAAALLDFPRSTGLSPNDYHIHRRPNELMILRFLDHGEPIDAFYERLQAHFDAGFNGYREEERQNLGWKQDPKTIEYLNALDALDIKMPDTYLRDAIRKHNLFILSTLTTDELNINFLCEDIMNTPPAEILGPASTPPDDPTEHDLSWFFKLFSLRGLKAQNEQMLFFAYLQKSDDSGW